MQIRELSGSFGPFDGVAGAARATLAELQIALAEIDGVVAVSRALRLRAGGYRIDALLRQG